MNVYYLIFACHLNLFKMTWKGCRGHAMLRYLLLGSLVTNYIPSKCKSEEAEYNGNTRERKRTHI